jgi:hypothetical protein
MPAHIQMPSETQRNDQLRISIHEHDIQSLLEQYPKLTRTEVLDVIGRHGPMRTAVVTELERISSAKR